MSDVLSGVGISLAAAIMDHFFTNPPSEKIISAYDKKKLTDFLSEIINTEAVSLQNEHPYIDIEGIKEAILDNKSQALFFYGFGHKRRRLSNLFRKCFP